MSEQLSPKLKLCLAIAAAEVALSGYCLVDAVEHYNVSTTYERIAGAFITARGGVEVQIDEDLGAQKRLLSAGEYKPAVMFENELGDLRRRSKQLDLLSDRANARAEKTDEQKDRSLVWQAAWLTSAALVVGAGARR
jgi:hypothetical protein